MEKVVIARRWISNKLYAVDKTNFSVRYEFSDKQITPVAGVNDRRSCEAKIKFSRISGFFYTNEKRISSKWNRFRLNARIFAAARNEYIKKPRTSHEIESHNCE